jgi:hypothetical protein
MGSGRLNDLDRGFQILTRCCVIPKDRFHFSESSESFRLNGRPIPAARIRIVDTPYPVDFGETLHSNND